MFETREDATGASPLAPVSPDEGERRHGARHIAVMRVAKLLTRYGEELCLVRNISEGGLMANVWSDLAVGDPLTAEFKSGQHAAGHIVWRKENRIGVQFDQEVDVAMMLGGDEDPAPGFHPRAPRVNIAGRCRLRCGARYYAVDLCDISQGGAKLVSDDASLLDRIEGAVVLTIPGLEPIPGTGRWHGEDRAGIKFNTPLPLETLARWIAANRGSC